MTNEEAEEIRKTLNKESVDLTPVDSTRIGLKDGEIHSGDTNTANVIKWKVKPKVNLGKALAGDIQGAVGNTSLQLEFGREYKNDDVEILIRLNGNLHTVLNSPADSKNFQATFVATKRF